MFVSVQGMAIHALAVRLFVLIWSIRITSVSGSDCSTVFRNLPTFQTCQYRCRCKDNAQCNQITGECDSGCELGWMGPACQYRNIAKDNLKTQNEGGTSINTDFAIYAVDGDVNTCARTYGRPDINHYWRIQWDRDYRIVGLVVKLHTDDVNNFNKFRVETGTGPNNGDFNSACYQHDDSPGMREMEIMCRQPVKTRNLRIILDKPNIRLRVCEVEIYGGRDVTFNKPTNQTSRYQTSYSSLSVDGQPHVSGITDTCSTTVGSENNPYWLVDFLAEYVIQRVKFYGRLSPHYDQYSGYKISLLNVSSGDREIFKDSGNGNADQNQPMIIDLGDQITARYLKVVRPAANTLLTVCEIVTFAECPLHKCDWDCTTDCHCVAETTGTYQKDGNCPYGCSGRWSGVDRKCDIECTATMWGKQCQYTCGHCYEAEPCNVVTGHCENGCNGPWHTPECTQECNNKTYGINCAQVCGHCKNAPPCNISSGHCMEGCVSGWQPPLCQEACKPGSYGDGCTKDCGDCLGTTHCLPATGVCEHGCDPGYQTTFCNATCDSGRYGLNCSGDCGKCKNETPCNATNGECHGGCQPGWETIYCNKTCDPGKYGEGCASNCGNCSGGNTCHHTTGRCENGCAAGFKGELCNAACPFGSYGYNCNQVCGNCEDGTTCDHITGVCKSCELGYKLNLCTETCDNGTYGRNCAQTCGRCADNSQCNITTGDCPGECVTGYEGPLCEKVLAMLDDSSGSISAGMIIGVLAGVLVVGGAGCAAVILIFRRRNMHSKSRNSEVENCSTFTNSTVIQDDKGEAVIVPNDVNIYNNSCLQRNNIEVSALRQLCVSAKRNPEALYRGFKELPYGLKLNASEARDPKFKSKNRYKDMYPYNETRVHLPEIPGDELSTYINASNINGYDIPNKYIAAQGAMDTTTSDMWRMVWSKNVYSVVMLTNCVELGKLKCMKYWPDEGTEIFGEISVEIVKSESYSDFIIRTFECIKVSSGEKREVLQFHYTAWPDKDVPDTALSLVQFWRTVRYNQASKTFPWIVHCSAGVGRTGTFIALDFLYEMGTAEHAVNILDTVNTLREQRLNMVQTKEQYVYVHETVAEVLIPIGSVCRNDDFPEIFQSLFHDNGQPKQKLIKEFEDVNKYKIEKEDPQDAEEVYCNVFRSQSADAKLEENLEKSRDMDISPADIHRPRLSMVVMGRKYFINASYIPTFRNRDRLILTQVFTGKHGYRLLANDLGIQYYNYRLVRRDFTRELMNERVEDCYVLRRIVMSLNGRTEQKEFQQFHFKSWPQNKSTPIDTGSTLRLISDIENSNTSRGHAPIVVQCLNGATKSGVFSTLWCLLEKAKSDSEIAVAETVRMSRMRRKQIIEDFEQYKYCYNVMRDYLDSFNVYANAI